MSGTLSVAELVDYFEDRIDAIDRSELSATHGKVPNYPMLVLLLGGDAKNAYGTISESLFRMWPQYQDELVFLAVDRVDEELEFIRVGQGDEHALSDDEIDSIMDELLATNNHFADRTRQLLYYVIDTTSFASSDELDEWLDCTDEIKDCLDVDEEDVVELQFVLLNERGRRSRRGAIKSMRMSLAKRCADEELCHNRVVLLSNVLEDGSRERTWDNCYRICASVIALSNNDDRDRAETIFRPGVVTAAYVREEKPVSSVGQVVVGSLVDLFNGEVAPRSFAKDAHRLYDRLGISRSGTLDLFSRYVETELMDLIPQPSAIEAFPRRNSADQGSLSTFSAYDLDDLTYGTYSAHLRKIVEDARSSKSWRLQSWAEEFGRKIRDEFDDDELIYLGDHLEDVRSQLVLNRGEVADGSLQDYARRYLCGLISSDEMAVNVLLEEIERQAIQARGFRDVCDALYMSRLRMHELNDQNLSTFYKAKVRSFLDYRDHDLRNQFHELTSQSALRDFYHSVIDAIIEADKVYRCSFEEELDARLANDSSGVSSRAYIRQKLSSDNVRTYLNVQSTLDNRVLSAALLRDGTDLQAGLKDFLDPQTYYYDMGYGNAVEVINLYKVEPRHL